MVVSFCEKICDNSDLIRNQKIYHPLDEDKEEANNGKKLETVRLCRPEIWKKNLWNSPVRSQLEGYMSHQNTYCITS